MHAMNRQRFASHFNSRDESLFSLVQSLDKIEMSLTGLHLIEAFHVYVLLLFCVLMYDSVAARVHMFLICSRYILICVPSVTQIGPYLYPRSQHSKDGPSWLSRLRGLDWQLSREGLLK